MHAQLLGSSLEPPLHKAQAVPKCPPLWQPLGGSAVTGINSGNSCRVCQKPRLGGNSLKDAAISTLLPRIFRVHARSGNKLLPRLQTSICTKGEQGEHGGGRFRYLWERCFSAAQWPKAHFSAPIARFSPFHCLHCSSCRVKHSRQSHKRHSEKLIALQGVGEGLEGSSQVHSSLPGTQFSPRYTIPSITCHQDLRALTCRAPRAPA